MENLTNEQIELLNYVEMMVRDYKKSTKKWTLSDFESEISEAITEINYSKR